ncbi:MAG: hypothetical protein GTN74_14755 [Proteobacteria bacterium]|nr:hypothetical protein [Pseudomonadota bacterium]NIS71820.1 hypothetical protein [Pseudomonadota bacterium]
MKKFSFLLFVLVFFFLSACGGRTFLVDLRYMPQTPFVLRAEPSTVALAPFIDDRTEKGDVGVRRRLDGSVDRFTTAPTPVAEGVKKAVERFLRRNGFTVQAIEKWDLKPASLSKVDAEMVVGGEIKQLWSRADSVAGRTIVTTSLEIIFYLGKTREGKVLEQGVEIEREITQVIFSPEKVEESVNESLSEIIESAFAKLLS